MTKRSTKLAKTVGGVQCAAVSDVGMRRANNQDSLAVAMTDDQRAFDARGHLFLVADGMGAHAAGELASQIASDSIPLAYHKRRELPPAEALVAAVEEANAKINAKGQNSVDFLGMGTTCSCLSLLSAGAVVAHVGDSRVYRLRDAAIEQLTFDHSLVWEMAQAGQAGIDEVPAYVPKNVITRSLGPHSAVQVDLEGPFAVQQGDVYLLCSDGLTGPLSSELLGLVIGVLPPEEAAQTLVDLANLLGGPDNITVIVARVDDSSQYAPPSRDSSSAVAANGGGQSPGGPEWITLGVAAVAAVLGTVLLVDGNHTTGVVALVVAALATVGAWFVRRPAAVPSPQPTATIPSGKAPYRRYCVTPGPEHIEMLSDIVRQLEDLESQRDWHFDWSQIHADRQGAHQAIATGDYHAATVAYCSAVRRLMQAVRANGDDGGSESSINLGEE